MDCVTGEGGVLRAMRRRYSGTRGKARDSMCGYRVKRPSGVEPATRTSDCGANTVSSGKEEAQGKRTHSGRRSRCIPSGSSLPPNGGSRRSARTDVSVVSEEGECEADTLRGQAANRVSRRARIAQVGCRRFPRQSRSHMEGKRTHLILLHGPNSSSASNTRKIISMSSISSRWTVTHNSCQLRSSSSTETV